MKLWLTTAVLLIFSEVMSGQEINVALNKPASMSSTYTGSLPAGGAVDGDVSTTYPDVIQTALGKSSAWWIVDLGSEIQTGRVELYFRTDETFRRNGVKLYTSRNPFSTHPGGRVCHTVTGNRKGTNIAPVVNVSCPGIWRYLMVYTRTNSGGGGPVLDFGEVKVLVAGKNVALNKPATMSSSYEIKTLPAEGAVDGSINTKYPGVIHTGLKQSEAWWKVDLERVVEDAKVEIYFRTDFKGRRNGVLLYTSSVPFASIPMGQLCYTVVGSSRGTDIQGVVRVTCTGRWRYLLVYTRTSNDGDGAVLDFGEVRVLACPNGSYGPDCKSTCGYCKNNETCHPVTGLCPHGCEAGWQLNSCQETCHNGSYGPDCKSTCGYCKNNETCLPVTGLCPHGCEAGWQLNFCQEKCSSDTYGPGCSSMCGNCTGDDICDHETGNCPGDCKPGWRGSKCIHKCSIDTYGPGCSSMCGNCTGDDICDPMTGNCPGECRPGWRGSKCIHKCSSGTYGPGCSSMCGNCTGDDICDHMTGNCPGDCKRGWRGRMCIQIEGAPTALNQTAVLAGTVTAAIVIVLIAIISVILWRRRKRPLKREHPDHIHYKTAPQRVEIKDHGYEASPKESLHLGEYDIDDMSDYLLNDWSH